MKKNLEEVTANIKKAVEQSGRKLEDVTLVAVSKTKPLEALQEAYALGCREFGENKVQEMLDKMEHMPDDVHWHMIGHLQTNKVKYIVGKVFMIHSVDSLKLAKEISKESVKKNVITNILIEINVAGEASKFGSSDMEENLELLKDIVSLPNLSVKGLMTIAPFTSDAETNRIYFRQLKQFADTNADLFDGKPLLSMGMSGDYMVAIEEGANYVRVGTSLFGARNYSI